MVRKNDNVELESTDPVDPFDSVTDESGGSDDEGDQKPHIGDGVYQADGEIDKTIADDTEIAFDDENGERQQIPRSEYQEKGLG